MCDEGGRRSDDSSRRRVSGFSRYEELRLRRLRRSGSSIPADRMSYGAIALELHPAQLASTRSVEASAASRGSYTEGTSSRATSSKFAYFATSLGTRSTAMRAFVPPLSDPASVDAGIARGALSLEVNKRVRHTLLKQRFFSNRFHGSAVAEEAEEEYQLFVSQYHRPTVVRRFVQLALLLGLGTVYDTVVSSRSVDYVVLRTILPMSVMLLGALACVLATTRRWWRLVVITVGVCAHASILAADAALRDIHLWSACDKDYATVWQLLWALLAMSSTALFFALDVSHATWALLLQWVVYLTAAMALHARWWDAAGLGPWQWPSSRLPAHSGGGGTTDADVGSSRMIIDCLAASTCGLLLLLLGVRHRSRSERQVFINSFVMHSHVSKQKRTISVLKRESAELLALFSNPTVPPQSPITLRPLALGQELKFLMRALPHEHLAVEPAASIEDVGAAVRAHNPRILLFSGHSFMGSLAFELPDGRIDLPPAASFIRQLSREAAPRLECVFLNGCHTAALGHKLVEQMPWLYVICWCSITEDAAARAFATGFYDAVGDFIYNGESIGIELAYWLGLGKMYSEGFRLGDPASYLHHPTHPHVRAPVFSGCDGCCPPVHGNVVLLASHSGQVHVLKPLPPDPLIDARPQTPMGKSLLRRSSLLQRRPTNSNMDGSLPSHQALADKSASMEKLTYTEKCAPAAAECSHLSAPERSSSHSQRQAASAQLVVDGSSAPAPGVSIRRSNITVAAAALDSSVSGSLSRRRSTESASGQPFTAAAAAMPAAASAASSSLDSRIAAWFNCRPRASHEARVSMSSEKRRSADARVAAAVTLAPPPASVCTHSAMDSGRSPAAPGASSASSAVETLLQKLHHTSNVTLLTQWYPVTPHDLIKIDILDISLEEASHSRPPAERRPSLFSRPSAGRMVNHPLARGSSALSRRASQALFGAKKKSGGPDRPAALHREASSEDVVISSPSRTATPRCSTVVPLSLPVALSSCESLDGWRVRDEPDTTGPSSALASGTVPPVQLCSLGASEGGSESHRRRRGSARCLASDPLSGALSPSREPGEQVLAPSPIDDTHGASDDALGDLDASHAAGEPPASAASECLMHVLMPASEPRSTSGAGDATNLGASAVDGASRQGDLLATAETVPCEVTPDAIRIDVVLDPNPSSIVPLSARPTVRAPVPTQRRESQGPGSARYPASSPDMLQAQPLPPRLSRVISFDARDSERRERIFRATAATRASRASAASASVEQAGSPVAAELSVKSIGEDVQYTPQGSPDSDK